MSDTTLLPRLTTILGADPRRLATIEVLATDVDGTLTRAGKLTSEVVAAIADLNRAGIRIVLVSGRSAGEVLGLCRYLPGVREGLAENGGVVIEPDRPPQALVGVPDRSGLKEAAARAARACKLALTLAPDDPFRVVDVAYERAGRTDQELERFRAAVDAEGKGMVWSSVHFHVAPETPDKGAGLLTWCRTSRVDPKVVATLGDAPNDAGLFVPGRFGLTIGTADVVASRAFFSHVPQAVTAEREASGFLEVAGALLRSRPA